MLKKLFAIILIGTIAVLITTGCSEQNTDNNSETTNNNNDGGNIENNDNTPNNYFELIFRGVNIAPGQSFDPDQVEGEPTIARIPSSAFPDDPVYIYNYDDLLEINVVRLNGVDTIYFVHILCESISTSRGISINDPVSSVFAAYGDDYIDGGIRMSYVMGDVELSFLIINEIVASVEYWIAGLAE
ncbi:MAG: hypothetical protein FWB93_01115 [Oscillospiraceae bacterium]|nr:hypothetical protein [Oscillospiraceae bacterium]